MKLSISDKFDLPKLLQFTAPSMTMLVFLSLYSIVDGIFVSRYVGADALSALNIVYPVLGIVYAVVIMLATGGSAVISKKLGEEKPREAREILSMIAFFTVAFGVMFTTVVCIFRRQLCVMLGCTEALLPHGLRYLTISSLFAVMAALQCLYQSTLVICSKPGVGLMLTVLAGLANMVLDYVFVVRLRLGIAGAALATGLGQCIPAVAGTIIFLKRKQVLYYQRFSFRWRELGNACVNGSSEMVTNLSASVVTIAFNMLLLHMAGADGVAAISIIFYAQFLLTSLFMGFGIGVAPILGYQLGARRYPDIRQLLRLCIGFVLGSSVVIALLSYCGAGTIVKIFVTDSASIRELGTRGMALFSLSFLFSGLNIFASGYFTAISDGKHSAILSFLRTFVFILSCLALLPGIWGLDGVWLAIPAAEAMTLVVTILFFKKYGLAFPAQENA